MFRIQSFNRIRGLFAILIALAMVLTLAQPTPVGAQTARTTEEIWADIEAAHNRGDQQAETALAETLPEPDRSLYFDGQANEQKSAGPSGGGPFIGINGAACAYTFLDYMAAASDGDTIYIAPLPPVGRFGTVNKNLTFTAATADCTAQSAGPVTITGDFGLVTNGGVAMIASGKTVTFRNLVLMDNGTATLGGILYVSSNATVTLDHTDLYSGSAGSLGGGARVIPTPSSI
jgi:hypothetical protein